MSDLSLDAVLELLADKLAEKLAARQANANGNGHHPPEEPDKLITADEAAVRLGVTVRWLYSHDLPFTVRLPGSRAVRFSTRGIDKWLARRTG